MFSYTRFLIATAALAGTAVSMEMVVNVGGTGGNIYTPAYTSAMVGDTVKFVFVASRHSVAQGSFDAPCTSGSVMDPFYSGIIAGDGTQSFTITITNMDPIYFYCSFVDHCMEGMVGGINTPTTGNTVDAYSAGAHAYMGEAVSPAATNTVVGGGMAAATTPAADMGMDMPTTTATDMAMAMDMPTTTAADMAMDMPTTTDMAMDMPTTTGMAMDMPTTTGMAMDMSTSAGMDMDMGMSSTMGMDSMSMAMGTSTGSAAGMTPTVIMSNDVNRASGPFWGIGAIGSLGVLVVLLL